MSTIKYRTRPEGVYVKTFEKVSGSFFTLRAHCGLFKKQIDPVKPGAFFQIKHTIISQVHLTLVLALRVAQNFRQLYYKPGLPLFHNLYPVLKISKPFVN